MSAKKERFTGIEQICDKCNLLLPIDKFEWRKNRPNPRKTCNKCKNKHDWETLKKDENRHKRHNKYRTYLRIKNDEKVKDSFYRSTYSVTYKEKLLMVEEQDNKCKICNKEFENSKDTHLDHCHTTGEIRGILCSNCNKGLGCFKDNEDFLKEAIIYLKNSREALKDYGHIEYK